MSTEERPRDPGTATGESAESDKAARLKELSGKKAAGTKLEVAEEIELANLQNPEIAALRRRSNSFMDPKHSAVEPGDEELLDTELGKIADSLKAKPKRPKKPIDVRLMD
jgi:hypothetical protein